MILAPHQGSIILQREKKNKDIRGTFLILRLTNRQFKRSPALRSIHHQGCPPPHPPVWIGTPPGRGAGWGGWAFRFLCVECVALEAGKEGSPAPGPGANLWSASAEHGDLRGLFDLSTDVPEAAGVGTDVSKPSLECRCCQFALIAVEVPPSAL